MSDLAIRVENLSKRYRIGRAQHRHDTLRDALANAFKAPLRRIRLTFPRSNVQRSNDNYIWALKDVSFEVKQGEVVGIIGRNGAGKSTLLKILSRITEPTEGRAEVYGRIGSLLEVGTGFHPELSGRENIYLNGAILGMKKAEIERKFDEIVAFAEIEKFIDTPVKHYSSGMYVRLAFAVAAHLEPEILLVDEVLAVGDAAFQKKCLGKMREVAKEGRTVLFVSHDMAAVGYLCQRVLVLTHGQLTYSGNTHEGVSRYLEASAHLCGETNVDLTFHLARRAGCIPILRSVRLLDKRGTVRGRFACGEQMTIELTCHAAIPLTEPEFGIGVDDWMGARIFSVATYFTNYRLPALEKSCKITCRIDELPLVPGRYSLSFSAGTPQNLLLDAIDNAVFFDVEPGDFFGNGRVPERTYYGPILMRSRWEKVDTS